MMKQTAAIALFMVLGPMKAAAWSEGNPHVDLKTKTAIEAVTMISSLNQKEKYVVSSVEAVQTINGVSLLKAHVRQANSTDEISYMHYLVTVDSNGTVTSVDKVE